MLFTGKTISADEARNRFGLWVVPTTPFHISIHFTCFNLFLFHVKSFFPFLLHPPGGGSKFFFWFILTWHTLFFFCCHSDTFSLFAFQKSVNTVVPGSEVLSTAISIAQQITANSPDAVQSSKVALLLSQNNSFQETFTKHNLSPESRRVYKGANIGVWAIFFYFIYLL